jgi:hypothetical protein
MTSPAPLSRPDVRPDLPPRLAAALRLLYEAHVYAASVQRDPWDFALEMASLRDAGLSASDLRWLACKGYVAHAAETTRPGKDRRSFHHNGLLTLADRSCFVLTEAGAAVVTADRPTLATATVPHWDGDRRELWVGHALVKRFRVPAENQELVLASFEEEGWPARIDDPLPPQSDLNPKRRLAEAINRLNHNQKTRLLRFHGDGSGRGVCWELLR